MKLKIFIKWLDTTLLRSAHSLSIFWLRTDTPVITLFNPLLPNIKRTTFIFSIPWSHLTLKGKPKFCTSPRNNDKMVEALLLDKHRKYSLVYSLAESIHTTMKDHPPPDRLVVAVSVCVCVCAYTMCVISSTYKCIYVLGFLYITFTYHNWLGAWTL